MTTYLLLEDNRIVVYYATSAYAETSHYVYPLGEDEPESEHGLEMVEPHSIVRAADSPDELL